MRFGHMGMVEIDEMVDAVRVMGETHGRPWLRDRCHRRLPGHPGRLRGIALRRRPVTARLLLVRHGVTTWNREGRFQGHLDPPLDPIGVEQARLLGARLAADEPGPLRIVTSPLTASLGHRRAACRRPAPDPAQA